MTLWNWDLNFYGFRKNMKIKKVAFMYLNEKEKYPGVYRPKKWKPGR